MKLMDIDADTLGIPETDYDARVTMTASEFGRIVRDLSTLGESVRIEVSKEGVRFASDGESANGSVLLKQTDAARAKYKDYGKDENVNQSSGGDEDEEQEEGDSKKKVKTEDDVEMNGNDDDEEDGEGEFKAKSDDEGEDEEDEEGERSSKKRKAPAKVCNPIFYKSILTVLQSGGKPAKKAKKSEEGVGDGGVSIEMNQHVSLTFSLKYLVNFAKSSSLSDDVQLMMSNDVPLLVSNSACSFQLIHY